MKEASAHLGGRAGSTAAVAPQAAAPTAAAAAEALSALQQRSRELLQRLMPCNLPFLAELLVGWLLQAALTGEAVMAAEVAALAQRDLGRFQRLNQRLQVGAVEEALLWQAVWWFEVPLHRCELPALAACRGMVCHDAARCVCSSHPAMVQVWAVVSSCWLT